MMTTSGTSNGHELMPPERELEDSRGDFWYVDSKGRKFFPHAPRVDEIDIEDIAFALSNICRWGGRVEFISVAEHCCMVSDYCPPQLKLLGLLHDADEALMGMDPVRPVKYRMPELMELSENLWKIVAHKFDLPQANPRENKILKEIDDRALLTERNQLMPAGPNTRNWWYDSVGLRPLNCRVFNWPPIVARREFLQRYHALADFPSAS